MSYPSPEEVVQAVLMEGLEECYPVKVSSPVRKQAQKITNALRAHGWRILREPVLNRRANKQTLDNGRTLTPNQAGS